MSQTNPAVSLRVPTAVLAALLAGTALGQIDLTGPRPTDRSFSNAGNPGTFTNSNLGGGSNVAANGVTLTLRGDFSYRMPREDSAAFIQASAYQAFTVGDAPARIDTFTFAQSAKWVNGGGNSTTPNTTYSVTFNLCELIGAAPSPSDPTIMSSEFVSNFTSGPSTATSRATALSPWEGVV